MWLIGTGVGTALLVVGILLLSRSPVLEGGDSDHASGQGESGTQTDHDRSSQNRSSQNRSSQPQEATTG